MTGQLDAIKGTSLSRVLCDTLDDSENLSIQPYPLHTPTYDTKKFKNDKPWAQFSMENPFPEFKTLTLPNFSNHRVPCSDESEIPKLNLNPWKDGSEGGSLESVSASSAASDEPNLLDRSSGSSDESDESDLSDRSSAAP
eukprot:XP_011666121.1 PREDICTED: uncharacterized protein LOC105439146 [Strongylocentrotus purpuratus]